MDLEFVRAQFPTLADDPTGVFCSNAGGSFVAQQVIELLNHYNTHHRVQPYYEFSPSREAGQAMDTAKTGWAAALNVAPEELTIGPSTSMNSYVMAQALGAHWGPGDEIVISQQDHEANIGAWERIAEQRGATVRWWTIDPESGLLDPDQLRDLLNENTRWVFFTHCSNIVGTINPVKDIVELVRSNSEARVGVDGVSYAPHHIANLAELGVDLYMFSLYKVYGPHQGLLYVNQQLSDELSGQGHYFNREALDKRYNPAGPQHAQVAACQGVLDYFDALHSHHGGSLSDAPVEKMAALHEMIAEQETLLAQSLLDCLLRSGQARVIGKTHCEDGDRAPTIAFKPLRKSSAQLAAELQAAGIGTENGDFYAPRAIEALGIDPADGVVRISLLHYNTLEDAGKITDALQRYL